MKPATALLLASALLLAAGIPATAAVVTTADNDSPAADGLTSLKEALEAVGDGETISFDIPGDGPHYLVTPADGYPLIQRNNVTIDGYSQPGASPNTGSLREPNNAVLKIVLDTRTGGRRVLDYPGFGTGESAVLGVLDGKGFTARGLAFIGIPGDGSEGDASIYHIALVKESTGAKVQGCWFGLDPAAAPFARNAGGIRPGIYGSRSAIASFRWDDTFDSAGLLIGTDSDGNNDNGEFNVFVEQRLPVHLQTPDAVVAGNRFNFLPNGEIFDYRDQQSDLGGDGTLEAIENGDGTNMRIGTNGDGVNDENEGNFFGPVRYNVFIEFWRAAPNAVIAGNSFGVDLAGNPAFVLDEPVSLLVVRAESSVRIGSNVDGTADAAEGNRIHGIQGPFIAFHGSNGGNPDGSARISLRGNDLTGNVGSIPLSQDAGILSWDLYGAFLVNPDFDIVPVLSYDASTSTLSGTVAPALPGTITGNILLDLYFADGPSLFPDDPFYPDGHPQGRRLLATYEVDGAQDANPLPAAFSFAVPEGMLADDLWTRRVVAATTYTLTDGIRVTTPFSAPAQRGSRPAAVAVDSIVRTDGGIRIEWSGGYAPFALQEADSPAGPWAVSRVALDSGATVPLAPGRRFFRIADNVALPAVQ